MGISIWQLLIVLLIVVLVFGTKRLKNIGNDLGGALKGFKDAVNDKEKDGENAKQDETANIENKTEPKVVEGEAVTSKDKTE